MKKELSSQSLCSPLGYFHSLGVDEVFDSGLGSALSLREAEREAVGRLRTRQEGSSVPLPLLSSACPGKLRFFGYEPTLILIEYGECHLEPFAAP